MNMLKKHEMLLLTFILKIYAHKIKINILLEVIKMVQDIVIEYYVTNFRDV